MLFFVLGLHLLQSRGYLLVRGRLGAQRQKGLGDKAVGIRRPPHVWGVGEKRSWAQITFT